MELQLRHVFGYNGTPLAFVDSERVVSICGNVLGLFSPKTGAFSFVQGDAWGIRTLAVSHVAKVIAYAERGPNPAVTIVSHNVFKRVATLPCTDGADCVALAFSRDGTRLISVEGLPNFTVAVWDWGKEKKLAMHRCGEPITAVSFYPRDRNAFCTVGSGHIRFWKASVVLDEMTLSYVEGVPPIRAAPKANPPGLDPVAHCWRPDGEVFVGCRGGQIVRVDPSTGAVSQENRTLEPVVSSSVCALLLTRTHLVVGCSDGSIVWLDLANLHPVMKTSSPSCGCICSMSFSPNFKSLVVGASTGCVFTVLININQMTTEVVEIRSCHTGAITGLGAIAGPSSLWVTCGVDGSVRQWNIKSGVSLDATFFRQGTDGSGIRWLLRPAASAAKLEFGTEDAVPLARFTSLTCHPSEPLMVVSSEDGVLRLLEVGMQGPPALIENLALVRVPIVQVAYNESGRLLAVGTVDGHVFFFDMRNRKFRVLGYLEMMGAVTAIAWNGEHLLVSLNSGDVYRFSAPPVDGTPSKTLEFEPDMIKKQAIKVQRTLSALVSNPTVEGKQRGQFLALAVDHKLKRYTISTESQSYLIAGLDNPAEEEYDGHEKRGCGLCVSNDGRFVASACSDGMVIVRSGGQLQHSRRFRCHDAMEGGAGLVCLSHDSRTMVTAGEDGFIMVFSEIPPPSKHALSTRASSRKLLSTESKTGGGGEFRAAHVAVEPRLGDPLIETWGAPVQHVPSSQPEVKVSVDEMQQDLADVKKNLLDLLKHNEEAQELEKLDRNDFVVDVERRDRIAERGTARAKERRCAMQKEQSRLEIIRERIKAECWDSMASPLRAVRSFCTPNLEVVNFPLPVRPESTRDDTRKVKLLRRVELAIARSFPFKSLASLEESPKDPTQHETGRLLKFELEIPDIDLGSSKKATPAQRTTSKEKTQPRGEAREEEEEQEEEEEEEESVVEANVETKTVVLLYHPLEAYTSRRRVTQLYLLRDLIHEYKTQFNVQFVKFVKFKDMEMGKIEERNERIRGICEELEVALCVQEPVLTELETPDKVLEVANDEIQVPKYLSPEEQQRMEEKQREHEAKMKAMGDDALLRALDQMMGNQVDEEPVKKALAEELPSKPEWMQKSHEELTDEEIKQVKEWELKERSLKEEKEKYRKGLETELKKLRGEIEGQFTYFDTKLQQLFATRLDVEEVVHTIEMEILRLYLHLLESERRDTTMAQLTEKLQDLTEKMNQSAQRLAKFKREVERERSEYDAVLKKDHALEEDFRRSFSEYKEHFQYLWKLFKKKMPMVQAYPGGGSLIAELSSHLLHLKSSNALLRSSPAGSRVGSLQKLAARNRSFGGSKTGLTESVAEDEPFARVLADPFSDVVDREAGGKVPRTPLGQQDPTTMEKPEGLDPVVWERITLSIKTKYAMERKFQKASARLDVLEGQLNRLIRHDNEVQSEYESLFNHLGEYKEETWRALVNKQVALKIKQGHVEVERAPVVTDFEDSILLNRSVILELNEAIRALSKEKIAILMEIRDVRRQIATRQWENKRFDLLDEDLMLKTRDLQLLRVTRRIQNLLKGSDASQEAGENTVLERRTEHKLKHHDDRVAVKRGMLTKLQRQVQQKQKENEALEEQLGELEVQVEERQTVFDIRATSKEIEPSEKKKMERVLAGWRIREGVERNDELIKTLQEELTRLQMRTFPSFPPSAQ